MDFDPEASAAATAEWYRARAAEFAVRTRGLDMAGERKDFTALLAPKARILDAGCGSGQGGDIWPSCEKVQKLRRGHQGEPHAPPLRHAPVS